MPEIGEQRGRGFGPALRCSSHKPLKSGLGRDGWSLNPPSSWFWQANRRLSGNVQRCSRRGSNVIKSISQRGLLAYWRRASEGRCIPDFGSFSLTDSDHDRHQLLFWHVVGSGYDRLFRSLFQGSHVVEGLGNTWLEVSKASFGPFQQYAFATLSDCADRRVPIYSVISTEDPAGQRIDCERLLLPFGRDPGVVDLVLASLQLVSNRGSFDRRSVMARFVAKCEFTYTADISQDHDKAALPA